MVSSQSVFDFRLPAAMGGADFMISDSNREAVEWLGNAQDWPVPALVIYGAKSSGKTHLCRIWQEIHNAIETTPAMLINEGEAMEMQAGGFYFVDDVDRVIAMGGDCQNGLFHLYNFLFNQGGRVLLTATRAPKEIDIALPDLSSRLLGAPAVEIKDPDDQTLQALLVKLFDDKQILIKPDIVTFLLPRIERSYQAIHKTVEGLDRLSLRGKRPVTIPLIRQWLDDQGVQE